MEHLWFRVGASESNSAQPYRQSSLSESIIWKLWGNFHPNWVTSLRQQCISRANHYEQSSSAQITDQTYHFSYALCSTKKKAFEKYIWYQKAKRKLLIHPHTFCDNLQLFQGNHWQLTGLYILLSLWKRLIHNFFFFLLLWKMKEKLLSNHRQVSYWKTSCFGLINEINISNAIKKTCC